MRKGVVLRVLKAGLALAFLLAAAGGLSAWSNSRLDLGAPGTDHLTTVDKARLASALELQQTYGERVFPGWGPASIPVLVKAGGRDFLVGHEDPPADWELVAGDEFQGAVYYRRMPLETGDHAAPIGGDWVAVTRTKGETDRLIVAELREDLPPLLRDVVPYRVLLQPTEAYLADVLHDLFHAYVASVAEERYVAADLAYWSIGGYPLASSELRPDAEAELEALLTAMDAESPEEVERSTERFLAARQRRRASPLLDAWAIELERESEWLKGLAKYAELETLRWATTDDDYDLAAHLANDGGFGGYGSYEEEFEQVRSAMALSLDRGRIMRFHYTGLAQALLLDRLLPDWKSKVLGSGVYLEDLLAEALQGPLGGMKRG